MYLLKRFVLFSIHVWACYCYSQDSLEGHHQLLVVTTQGWDEKQGELVLYERENDSTPCIVVKAPVPVVLGKNGLAWGIGLHPTNPETTYKKEGDGKSPAGIFSLGSAFGLPLIPKWDIKR